MLHFIREKLMKEPAEGVSARVSIGADGVA